MCSCSQHSGAKAEGSEEKAQAGVRLLVDDMTCGHCAGTIKSAIEQAFPDALVTAEPASKLVTVSGAGDYAAIEAIVTRAGYTPSLAAAA